MSLNLQWWLHSNSSKLHQTILYILLSGILGLVGTHQSACSVGSTVVIKKKRQGTHLLSEILYIGASLVALLVENLPAMWKTWV